ncbi:12313_t:CDS:1, partial [Racocetra fulgida]
KRPLYLINKLAIKNQIILEEKSGYTNNKASDNKAPDNEIPDNKAPDNETSDNKAPNNKVFDNDE